MDILADSSSQYDAIRAYLKELDITEKVWIGLSKTAEKSSFTWTDFRPLTGEGHWQEALPSGDTQSLCAVTDPAADFLWKPLPCGGPEVAAFICELPIPTWAQGPRGCLLTELPSLTVLYIPEQSALELTSDCGLDGTKRIACRGDADREEMLKQLSCTISHEDIDDDKLLKSSTTDDFETTTLDDNSITGKTTKSWVSNTIDVDYGMATRHRRETEDTLSPASTTKSPVINVSRAELSWKASHHDVTVLTTQQNGASEDSHSTSTSSSAVEMEVTTDGTTATNHAVTLDSSITEKVFVSGTAGKQQTEETEYVSTQSALTTLKSSVSTSTPETVEVSSESSRENSSVKSGVKTVEGATTVSTTEGGIEEYPSAINQGQLFSIIDNGTMFDIIELNDTEQESPELKNKNNPQTSSVAPPSSSISASSQTATTQDIHTAPVLKDTPPTKKPITKKPLVPTKKSSNKTTVDKLEKPKTSERKDDKKNNENRKPTQTVVDLTKEFEMLPDIKDTSVKLNRTFRKELPPVTEDKEDTPQFSVPRVLSFSVSNNADDKNATLSSTTENSLINVTKTKDIKSSVNKTDDKATSKVKSELSSTVSPRNPIDPRIYILNHHPKVSKNNDSEAITTAKPNVTKEEFLPRSLLGETSISASPTKETTAVHTESSEAYSDHPFPSDEPKKINRHRSLHTTKPRKFYPYFFSRMLG
ncbi:hypothetical protein GWI33_022413 [Rhynchophorus ferrugineus]|uniref:C-type lectin domain-containing protein n=1 Tax=Rhynchophorus ferrugineus TaxID=354439 RepID=A0A834INF4_RHYFE|nr:hypothetical protein GWI33_022413 [Rhynchophorus ferrugineus]